MLRVRMLGELEIACDDVVVTPPRSRRAWTLLAWLALHPGGHDRGALAARFWPDVLDARSRGSLRSAMWELRRALGPHAPRYLLTTRDRVGIAHDDDGGGGGGVWVDAHAFEAYVAAGEDEAAVALCARGELLAGIEDDWALLARDEHRERLAAALERLARAAAAAGDDAAALDWTRRQVALDPFGEAAHRRLMTRLAAAGEHGAALAAYRRFAARLARELELTPSAATRELAASLRARAAAPRVPPFPSAPPSPADSRSEREPMPSFHDAADCPARPQQVWRLLADVSRLHDWWVGAGAVEALEADGGALRLACRIDGRRCAWQLTPLEDGGTRIAVEVELPPARRHRLDDERAAIHASLARLATLAAR